MGKRITACIIGNTNLKVERWMDELLDTNADCQVPGIGNETCENDFN